MISTPAPPRVASVAVPGLWLAGLLASVGLGAAVALGWLAWDRYAKAALLVVQYGLLLPAALRFRRAAGVAVGEPFGRELRYAAILLLCAVAMPLAAHLGDAIYSGDESAYLFQARLFAAGRLTAESPAEVAPPRLFHFQHHLMHEGRWFGKYPPGWPALLAPATLVHGERLLNPLAGLMILWLTWRIGLLLFGIVVAEHAVLLLAASPFFTLSCVDYLSHAPACLLLALALYCLLLAWRGRHPARALGGMLLALFLLALVRPYVAAWTGSLLGLGALWLLRFRWRKALLLAGAGAAAAVLALFVLLWFNKLVTGAYWPHAYALYTGTREIAEVSLSPASLWRNLTTLTAHALGETVLAGFPFLPPLAGFAVWRNRRRSKVILLLAALAASLVVAYLAQSRSSFSLVGERYYFETFFLMALLGALGWTEFWAGRPQAARLALGACLLLQMVLFPVYGRRLLDAHAPSRQVLRAVRELPLDDAVVFLRNSVHFRAFDLNPNPPDWRRAPLFLMADPGPARRRDVVCSLGRRRWVTAGYDDARGVALVGAAQPVNCPRPGGE
ncbi:MAG: hypothetical protein ACK58M_05110 [Acidobacteriota bacterium]|nr:hypothetical protein [Bryobacteraceae bacterium CoA2 C42]